jgi:hypothetical protein
MERMFRISPASLTVSYAQASVQAAISGCVPTARSGFAGAP